MINTETVGAWTHWCRRDSVAKSRSWESVVFGGGRIFGPVNFGTIKITKEKAVGATRDEKEKYLGLHLFILRAISSNAAATKM